MDDEEWRAVEGYEGSYEVSDQGRVRSLDRTLPPGGGNRELIGRVLRPGLSDGYEMVSVSRTDKRYVHQLVAATFHGPRPAGMEVRHLDGNARNNRLDNLAYGTKSRNGQDKKHHRLPRSYKLTGRDAAEVKRLLAAGVRGVDIARQYGLAKSTVSALKHGTTHRDVVAAT